MSEQPTDEFVNEPQRQSLAVKAGLVATGAALSTAAFLGHAGEAGASTPSATGNGTVATEAAPTPVNVSDPTTPNQAPASNTGTETAVPRTPDPNKPGDPGHFDVITTSPKPAPEHGDPVYVSPKKAPEHGDPVYVPSANKVEPKQATPTDISLPKVENSVPVVVAPTTTEASVLPTSEQSTPQAALPVSGEAPMVTTSVDGGGMSGTEGGLVGVAGAGLVVAGAAGLANRLRNNGGQ